MYLYVTMIFKSLSYFFTVAFVHTYWAVLRFLIVVKYTLKFIFLNIKKKTAPWNLNPVYKNIQLIWNSLIFFKALETYLYGA